MDIPFEGIVTILLFIIGVPAFVLQFITPEERKVVFKRHFWRDIILCLAVAVGIIILAIIVKAWYAAVAQDEWLWGSMYLSLALVAGIVAYYIPNHYGRRENLVSDLMNQASRNLPKNGKFDANALSNLIMLGKQCESGDDRELVLDAMDKLVEQACCCPHYRSGMLESIIDETVNMLISQPHPEDFQSFRSAVGLLTRIVTSDLAKDGSENLVDHQRAVRALSALGQAVLAQVGYSIGVDYILIGYLEAFRLAVLKHPDLITDVSQALFETGAVAIDSKNFLFAVAAMERLFSIVENRQFELSETNFDMLGLLAHFWTADGSSRAFAELRLERVRSQITSLEEELAKARLHCQFTMEFETADKITEMLLDLKCK